MPSKPMGAIKPPRDIEESERWLKECRARDEWWPNLKSFFSALFLILALPAFVGCVAWSLFEILVR